MPSNKKIIEMLYRQHRELSQHEVEKIHQYIDDTMERIVYQNNCILISSELVIHEDLIKRNYENLTNYEAVVNQINLNKVFETDNLSAKFALRFFKSFKKRLKIKFADLPFGASLVLENSNWVFRFHINRNNQGIWAEENIKNVDMPLIFELF